MLTKSWEIKCRTSSPKLKRLEKCFLYFSLHYPLVSDSDVGQWNNPTSPSVPFFFLPHPPSKSPKIMCICGHRAFRSTSVPSKRFSLSFAVHKKLQNFAKGNFLHLMNAFFHISNASSPIPTAEAINSNRRVNVTEVDEKKFSVLLSLPFSKSFHSQKNHLTTSTTHIFQKKKKQPRLKIELQKQ